MVARRHTPCPGLSVGRVPGLETHFNLDLFREELALSALCRADLGPQLPDTTAGSDVSTTMIQKYDVTMSALLARHAAPRVLQLREHKSDAWFSAAVSV